MKGDNHLGGGNSNIMLHIIKVWLKAGSERSRYGTLRLARKYSCWKKQKIRRILFDTTQRGLQGSIVTARPIKEKLLMWSEAERSISVFYKLKGIFFFSWHTLLHCHMPFICVCRSSFWNVCHLPGIYEHLWLLRVAATNLGNALQEVPWVSVEKVQEQNQHIGSRFADLCFLKERHKLAGCFLYMKKMQHCGNNNPVINFRKHIYSYFKVLFIPLYFSAFVCVHHLSPIWEHSRWQLSDTLLMYKGVSFLSRQNAFFHVLSLKTFCTVYISHASYTCFLSKASKGRNILALHRSGCFAWVNANQMITFRPSFSSELQ